MRSNCIYLNGHIFSFNIVSYILLYQILYNLENDRTKVIINKIYFYDYFYSIKDIE